MPLTTGQGTAFIRARCLRPPCPSDCGHTRARGGIAGLGVDFTASGLAAGGEQGAHSMQRRNFLAGAAAAATLPVSGTGAQAQAAGVVDARKLLTTTAALDPARPEAARLFAKTCKELGWDVEVVIQPYAQAIQGVINDHTHDMFLTGWAGTVSRIDPDTYIYLRYHSSQAKKGGYNFSQSNDPAMDRIADAQRREMDLEKRRALVYEAQRLIEQRQAEITLAYMSANNAHRSDRLGNVVPMMGEGIGGFWTDIEMTVLKGDGYARNGGTGDVPHLNPIAARDITEFAELASIYDRLFQIDRTGRVVPWAATGYSFASPTTMDITLRDGMKFHDGMPVTAGDAKFSIDYHKAQKSPYFSSALQIVDSVEITGKLAIRINFTEPSASFMSNVLAYMFLIPAHIWKDYPGKAGVDDVIKFPNEAPIGSGPFRFVHWRRGSELKVDAVKDHHHAPKCAGMIRSVYGSHDAMAAAIEKDECDRTRYLLSIAHIEALSKVKGVIAKPYPSHGFYSLALNTQKPPFDKQIFRQALHKALPTDFFIDVILKGSVEPAGSVISPVNAFWHDSSVKPVTPDVKAARKMLGDAGYKWDSAGRLLYPTA